MQRVLGLGGSNHDFSAALVEDGEIRVAIEDERVQRIKYGNVSWHSSPTRDAALYCLDAADLSLSDIDLVVANDDLERPHNWIDWSRVKLMGHHLAHAAASFFTSDAKSAAVLVIDGHGSPLAETANGFVVETISVGRGDGVNVTVDPLQTGRQKKTSSSWRYVGENSAGALYEIVSTAIGFGDSGAGKTMGLAAYGSDRLVRALFEFVEIGSHGTFRFDPYGGIWDWLVAEIQRAANDFQVRADLAFAVQEIFGDAVVAAALEAYRLCPSAILAYGGGCSLNTLANSRILAETPFERLAVFPAAADDGLAIGCALYGYYSLLGHARRDQTVGWQGRMAYLGRQYSDDEISAAIDRRPVSSTRPVQLESEVVRILADGGVVGVHRGKSEIGPRALGNRSLLAAPHSERMRDHINLNVKERESFRPLAPAVPFEVAEMYFDGPPESPFMLLVSTVRPEFRDRLAAVTHIDGTARIQTVRREDNPFLHRLLTEYGKLTGIPVLLNTSMNLPGRPIVETPSDALELFIQRPVDVLVLGDRLIRKYSPWAGPGHDHQPVSP